MSWMDAVGRAIKPLVKPLIKESAGLTVLEPGETYDGDSPLHCITVHRPRFYLKVVVKGSLGNADRSAGTW